VVNHSDEANEHVLPCRHTLFIAHDGGFEYRSALFDSSMEIEGVDDDDIDLGDESVDGYTDLLRVENSVKLAIYVPPPGLMGFYIGFACLDD
jgi:hypothetical protein